MDSTCKHFEKGIFESAQLLQLLKDQLVVVPLELLSDISHLWEVGEYFMSADAACGVRALESSTAVDVLESSAVL